MNSMMGSVVKCTFLRCKLSRYPGSKILRLHPSGNFKISISRYSVRAVCVMYSTASWIARSLARIDVFESDRDKWFALFA